MKIVKLPKHNQAGMVHLVDFLCIIGITIFGLLAAAKVLMMLGFVSSGALASAASAFIGAVFVAGVACFGIYSMLERVYESLADKIRLKKLSKSISQEQAQEIAENLRNVIPHIQHGIEKVEAAIRICKGNEEVKVSENLKFSDRERAEYHIKSQKEILVGINGIIGKLETNTALDPEDLRTLRSIVSNYRSLKNNPVMKELDEYHPVPKFITVTAVAVSAIAMLCSGIVAAYKSYNRTKEKYQEKSPEEKKAPTAQEEARATNGPDCREINTRKSWRDFVQNKSPAASISAHLT